MFWRHVVAASERVERAGSEAYHENHMGAIFKEGFSFSGYERDLLVLNDGRGRYVDVSGVSGIDSISDGRGSVFADFDNDGDTDVFLTTAQREAHFLFRNDVGSDRRFLRVELVGDEAGRDAYGAIVRIGTSRGIQTEIKSGGGSFLSHHDPRLLFGLGDDREAEWVEVAWPGGGRQRVEHVPADTSIRIVQGRDGYRKVDERRFSLADRLDPEAELVERLPFRTGDRFPAIALRDGNGRPVALSDLLTPERRTLINLWATWCTPCAREIPELSKLHEALRTSGVDLVGISVDFATIGDVPGYVKRLGVTYPILTTDESGLDTLFPSGEATVPLTILVDDGGLILDIHSGWSERSARAMRGLAGGE